MPPLRLGQPYKLTISPSKTVRSPACQLTSLGDSPRKVETVASTPKTNTLQPKSEGNHSFPNHPPYPSIQQNCYQRQPQFYFNPYQYNQQYPPDYLYSGHPTHGALPHGPPPHGPPQSGPPPLHTPFPFGGHPTPYTSHDQQQAVDQWREFPAPKLCFLK